MIKSSTALVTLADTQYCFTVKQRHITSVNNIVHLIKNKNQYTNARIHNLVGKDGIRKDIDSLHHLLRIWVQILMPPFYGKLIQNLN